VYPSHKTWDTSDEEKVRAQNEQNMTINHERGNFSLETPLTIKELT
jgi:hypothetical protein